MPLEKSGIEYTSKGFTKFISDMTKAGDMVVRLGEACDKTAQKLNAAVTGYAALAQGTKAVSSSVKELTKSITDKTQVMDKDNLATKIMITTAALAAQKVKEQYTDMTNHMKSVTSIAAQKIKEEHENMANAMSTSAALAAQRVKEEHENMANAMSTGTALAAQKVEEEYADMTNTMATGAALAAQKNEEATASIVNQQGALKALGNEASKTGGLLGKIGGVIKGIFSGAEVGAGIGLAFPTIGEEIPLAIVGAIIGGLSAALSEVSKAIDSFWESVIKKLSDTGKVVGKVISTGLSIAKGIYDMGKKIVSAIGDTIKTILNTLTFGAFGSGSFRSLGDSVFGAMLKFEVLKQVVRKLIQEFKDYINVATEAAKTLQTLTIRLDNLIARQVRSVGITEDYSESMAIATAHTQEMLGWIRELAVATPFSEETISNTVSLAMAMGWGIDATKELTGSILDYSAAQGLSNDVMERIIYNFAQMRQAGKVTGTELRDLARGAFMPINDILNEAAKMLGIAADQMDEFREAAADGTIDVETFFDAFISVVNRDFPDAARRMNFTFDAVMDNIRDLFRTLVGWNMLKPTFDAIARSLQKLIEKINTPQVIRATKALGLAFEFVWQSIQRALGIMSRTVQTLFQALGFGIPSLENVIKFFIKFGATIELIAIKIQNFIYRNILPTFRDLRDDVENIFGGTSDDMFTYGFNMIVQFAEGMMQGIATVMSQVFSFLSNILGYYLQTHSPPRIAPQIDLWGMETMAEWLHGFTEADFSMLDSLEDNLKGALGALVDLGVIDEELSAEMYVNISADLIGAIEEFNRTGEMTEVIFEQLSTVSGVFGEELINLLNLQIELAEATERVADAQEAYNAAVDATEQATSTVHSLVREYNAMLRAGTDNAILEQRLAELNAAELQMLASQEAEQAAQAELEAAEDALDPIQEMVDLQEELIQQLIELAQAQADAAEAAYGGGGGGGGDGAGAEDGGLGMLFPDLDKQKMSDTLAAWFEDLKGVALEELGDLWDQLKTRLQASFNRNFGPGSQFRREWLKMVDNLRLAWNEFADDLGLPSWEEIAAAFNEGANGETGFAAVVAGLGEVWDLFVADVIDKGGSKAGETGTLAGTLADVNEFLTTMKDILQWVKENWEILAPVLGVVGLALLAVENPLLALIGLWGILTVLIYNFIESAREKFEELKTIISTKIDEVRTNLHNVMTDIRTRWDNAWNAFRDVFQPLFTAIANLFSGQGNDGIAGTIASAAVSAIRGIAGLLSSTAVIEAFVNVGESIVEGIIQGIENMLGELAGAISNLGDAMDIDLSDKIDKGSPAKLFIPHGESITQGIALGITKSTDDLRNAMSYATNQMVLSSRAGDMRVARMSETVKAPAVSAGSSVTFGDVYVNDRIDLATLRTYVQQMILEN